MLNPILKDWSLNPGVPSDFPITRSCGVAKLMDVCNPPDFYLFQFFLKFFQEFTIMEHKYEGEV